MFEKIFDRFAEKAPVAVMSRGILERVFSADSLNRIFEESCEKQYTRDLLFSSVFHLMSLVVCRIQPSIHAAYQEHKDDIETSITAVYDKLNGIDISTSRALVRDTAARMAESVHDMGGTRQAWLPGYRVKVLDGNCIEASEHRIKALRDIASAPLPGKSLVIYEPELEMATDVFPCEDGHAQERSLLGQLLETFESKDVLIMDRNFCVRDFLTEISDRDAFYICRYHKGFTIDREEEERFIGKSETGDIYERWAYFKDGHGVERKIRKIRIELSTATRDGDKQIYLLSNLTKAAAPAMKVAECYRKRWTIETAFQELESHLHSEINALGYPKAALFGFCTALTAYNVLAVVKAALRTVHGEEKIAEEVSGYYLTGHIGRVYEGMDIAIPEEQWEVFRQMEASTFIDTLLSLASKIKLQKFKKHKRGAKTPKAKRQYNAKQPHVSTAKILIG